MSQTTTDADGFGTDDRTLADTLAEELAFICAVIESLDQSDFADMSDGELVNVREELKRLEGEVESARKDMADEEVKNRVDPGESLLGLSVIESHNKYVAEDDGAVVARAVSQGIDYTEFVSVNASTLADLYPDLAEIGESTYTYVR